MQSVLDKLDVEFPADPASVTAARHAAVELARDTGADEMDVQIAVSEAVGNAVVHAYPEGEPETVRLIGTVFEGRLVLVVQDRGVGMRPNPDSRGLRLGLPLIGQVTDDMHIEAHCGGTRVSMTFACSNA